MADSVQISHAFISAKPDSPDNSIVSSSEWNALLKIAGGATGQMSVRNETDPNGAVWVHGPLVNFQQASHSGVAPSPPLCSITITFTSIATIMYAVMASIVTADASAGTVQFFRDGVLQHSETVNPQGYFVCTRVNVINENVGTHTYNLRVTTTGAVITASNTQLTTFSIGRVS